MFKLFIKRYLVLLLLLFSAGRGKIAYAQYFPEPLYGSPTEQKWLPNYSIKAILQDKHNDIWVATNAGLYKYNMNNLIHYDITKYTSDKYLNNQIFCIGEAYNGNILVGTQSGLGQFDLNSNAITLISDKDQATMHIIAETEREIVYVAYGRDIYSLSPGQTNKGYERKLIFKGSNYHINLIKSVVKVGEDGYYIAASNGLWFFKGDKLYPTSISGTINALQKVGNMLWVGTAFQGLYKCQETKDGLITTGRYVPKDYAGQIESIQEIKSFDNSGVVFATTTKVFFAENQKFPGNGSIKEIALFQKNAVRKILVDKTMNIWIGTRNGLFCLNPLSIFTQFHSFDNSIYQNIVVNDLLALNNDSLLIATNAFGLTLLNTRNNKIQSTGTGFKNVKLMKRNPKGDILLVADDRFLKIKPDKVFEKPEVGKTIVQRGLNDIAEVSPGEFWFSHWRKKIIRLKDGPNPHVDKIYANIMKSFSSNVHMYGLEVDSKNNLWVGTRGEGLLRANLTTGVLKKFGRKDNFPDQIVCIQEDSKGRLWVGTRDKGLLLYQPETDSFKIFSQNDGLPSNTISAIQESATGKIWIATLNGTAQLNEGKFMSFQANYKESETYGSDFSLNIAEASKDGSVYFGTENGIYRFSKIQHSHKRLPLTWTNVDLIKGTTKNIEQTSSDNFSKKILLQIEESGTIVLDPDQNSLQIGFANLDYSYPNQNSYMYRMLGYDTTWSVLQGEKSIVRYFNLPPGEYVFQAMSTDSDDTYGNVPKSFAIVVKPSFWQTGFANALYILVFLLLSFTIYRIFSRWRSMQIKLEQEMRSSKIYDQQMIYYADLSHEIKNRLTLIMGPLEEALKNKKVNFQMLNRIYEQGQRLKRFSDQIMNIRKNESGDFLLSVDHEKISTIISKIVKDSRPLALVKDIKITFKPLQDQIEGWCDAEILEIIVMNIINNAIKYSRPNGTVEITLTTRYFDTLNNSSGLKEGSYMECTISDTGIGVAEEDISKILQPFYRAKDKFDEKKIPGKGIGLDLVARLVKKHHGTLHVTSTENEFTTFTIYLPIDKHAFSIDELRPDIKNQTIVIAEKNLANSKQLIFPDSIAEVEDKPATPIYNILAVDDDEDMLSYLNDIFVGQFVVMLASNAKQAMEIMNENKVDLVICDLDMGDMNGLTLCRIFKSNNDWTKIPFLLLTGRNSEEQKLIAFENGVDDFVEKPFRPELLSWRAKSLLKNNLQPVKLKTIIISDPSEGIAETNLEKFIQDVVDLIEQHIDKDYLNVDFLADGMCMSRATFYRKMEEMFGESPSVFIKKYRLKKAVAFIRGGTYSLKQVSDKTGFGNPKYFSKCFRTEFGVSPSKYFASETENVIDLS